MKQSSEPDFTFNNKVKAALLVAVVAL